MSRSIGYEYMMECLYFHFEPSPGILIFRYGGDNRLTQSLFSTGIERGIHNHQVLKYQPSVTSRLIFQYFMIINETK